MAFSFPVAEYWKTCSGRDAIVSDRILMHAYTAVVCMAVRSFTVLPLVVPPKKMLFDLLLR